MKTGDLINLLMSYAGIDEIEITNLIERGADMVRAVLSIIWEPQWTDTVQRWRRSSAVSLKTAASITLSRFNGSSLFNFTRGLLKSGKECAILNKILNICDYRDKSTRPKI